MLSEKMIKFIEKVRLVDRYKEISARYGDDGRIPMEKIEVEVVQEIISELGYSSKYDKGEKFFKVILVEDEDIQIGYNIDLKYGLVELIMFVYQNGKYVEGSPLCFIISQYTGEEKLIKDPRFGSYEELKHILEYMFAILIQYKEEE